MSRYQFVTNYKNLNFGETQLIGSCFQELSFNAVNRANSQIKLSTFETSAYFAMRIEDLNYLFFSINNPEPVVSFIFQKNKSDKPSTVQLLNSQDFSFSDFNITKALEFEIQSKEPGDFTFLVIRESDFRNFLDSNITDHQQLIAKLDSQKEWLFSENFNFGFALRHLLDSLLEIESESPFGHLLFQSKVLEIFAKTFEIIQQESSHFGPENCTWTRLKPLIAAKKIIEENLASPPSLSKISKLVGINEYDLKKGFKEQFGRTVFGYLGEQRMSLAYELLKTKTQTIGEISSVVGYKNPQHFSSAFKKRFGLSPRQIMDS